MKKAITILVVLFWSEFFISAFASDENYCKKLFDDRKYHSSVICFHSSLMQKEDTATRIWYAAALFYDRQFDAAYKQYIKIAKENPNSTFGEYAQKEAQKVQEKIHYIKNAKANDYGNYLSDLTSISKWYNQPIKVWIQPSIYKKNAIDAFAEWENSTQGLVSFKIVKTEKQGNINVYFVDNIEKTTNEKLGETYLKYKGTKIFHADIKIRQKTKSNGPCSNRQMYSVILHEIGHSLGLMGHSKNNNDIMFQTDFTNDIHLSQKDINTIKAIYQKK